MGRSHSTARRRLQAAIVGTSLGLFTVTAGAQDLGDNIGDSIKGAIGNQIGPGTGTIDRGVGEAVRGVLEGNDVGQSVQRGLSESARTLGETPNQTLQRDASQFGAQTYQNRQFGNQYQGNFGTQGRVVTRMGVDGQPYRVRVSGNQGAQLGISMQQNDQGIIISNIARGSAAAQAGLRPGDVLVNVGGQRVVNPSQVANLVNQRQVGDQLPLVVMRNGERTTINATLQGMSNMDAQRVARPQLDGNSDIQSLQQRIQQLETQLKDLQNQMRSLQGGAAASGDAAADAQLQGEIEADIDAADVDEAAEPLENPADTLEDAGAATPAGAGAAGAAAAGQGSAAVRGSARARTGTSGAIDANPTGDSDTTGLSGRAATTPRGGLGTSSGK